MQRSQYFIIVGSKLPQRLHSGRGGGGGGGGFGVGAGVRRDGVSGGLHDCARGGCGCGDGGRVGDGFSGPSRHCSDDCDDGGDVDSYFRQSEC